MSQVTAWPNSRRPRALPFSSHCRMSLVGAVGVAVLVVRELERVPDDRAPADLGDLFVEVEVPAEQLDEAPPLLAQHAGEREEVVRRHDVRDHGRAVVIALHAVLAQDLRGEPAGARVHRLAEQRAHLALLLGRRRASLGVLLAHHPGHDRREAHVGEHVHALRRAFDAVEVLGEGDPVPRHAGGHRRRPHGLVALQRQHRALAVLRADRREAEAAVADHHRGDPVPARHGAPGIPEDLRVEMGVQVDEARRHDEIPRVEHALRVRLGNAPDLRDAPPGDRDIPRVARRALAVDHGAALQDEIVAGHGDSPLMHVRKNSIARQSHPQTAPRSVPRRAPCRGHGLVPSRSHPPRRAARAPGPFASRPPLP